MNGETNLDTLIKSMRPKLNKGEFVFCTVNELGNFNIADALMIFKEEEAISVIMKKETADSLSLRYTFIAGWITLTVHSSLAAVGLTAAFSKALAASGISCNVVAACYHDHIFVDTKNAALAMDVLNSLQP